MKRLLWIILMGMLMLNYVSPVTAQDDDDGYAIALERIQEALETNATSLDLSLLNLVQVASEIGQLTALLAITSTTSFAKAYVFPQLYR